MEKKNSGKQESRQKKAKEAISGILKVIRNPRTKKEISETKPKTEKTRFGRSKKVNAPEKPVTNIRTVDGVNFITIKKTANNHKDWINNAEASGKIVRPYTKFDYLKLFDFHFDENEFELVILKHHQLGDLESKGYKVPDAELACFLLDALTLEDFEAMGLKSIQVAHEPIEWQDVLLMKLEEEKNPHLKPEKLKEIHARSNNEVPVQFVVSISTRVKQGKKLLEIHSTPFNPEARISKTRGIAFLARKK